MHPQQILALFYSLSFMRSRDFLGSVPSCIMPVFTGDPGFVSPCYHKSTGNVLLYIICVFTGDPGFV